MNDLSVKEEDALNSLVDRPILQIRFFKKISSIKWWQPLRDKGFLDESKLFSLARDETWPVSLYVGNLVKKNDVDYGSALEDILAWINSVTIAAANGSYHNYRLWGHFIRIFKQLGLTKSSSLKESLKYWCEDPATRSMGVYDLTDILTDAIQLKTNNYNEIEPILAILFSFQVVPHKEGDKNELDFSFESYRLAEFVKKYALSLGTQYGAEITQYFRSLLNEYLESKDNDRYGYIWRPAIEDHSQNIRSNEIGTILVDAVRDVLHGAIDSPECDYNSLIADFLSSGSKVQYRLALYVINKEFPRIAIEIIDSVFESDYLLNEYRYEVWHLLHDRYASMSRQSQSKILIDIESITRDKVTEEEPEELTKRRTCYAMSIWLSAIKNFDDNVLNKYQEIIDVIGKEPDHPDFSSYHSSMSAYQDSPKSSSELAILAKTPKQLVVELNDFTETGTPFTVGLEGLVKTFGAYCRSSIEEVITNLEELKGLKSHYLYELIEALQEAWKEKNKGFSEQAWSTVLDFCNSVVTSNEFWTSDTSLSEESFIGNRHWVVSAMARLIELACHDDKHSFLKHDVAIAKTVIEVILRREQGSEIKADSDAVSISINSPKGRALETYLYLALFEKRNCNDVEKEAVFTQYQTVLDEEIDKASNCEFEFIVLFSNFIVNFSYLSPQWVDNNLERVFGKKGGLQWLCAIQGFSYSNQLSESMYKFLKDNSHFAEVINGNISSERIRERYIELIVMAEVYGYEKIGQESYMEDLVLRQGNVDDIEKVIWVYWTIRGSKNPKVQKLVDHYWPILVGLSRADSSGKIASQLCFWCRFVTKLESEALANLKAIAPFAEVSHNASYVLDMIERLSDKYPDACAEIWIELAKAKPYPYPVDKIKKSLKNIMLNADKGRVLANKVSDAYINVGIDIFDILKEAKSEIEEE